MVELKVILVSLLFCYSAIAAEDTLKQVHVVFRHGDRTPVDNVYPTDPHINDTYYPDGYGALTKYGKMQEYKIGKALRERYDTFLGEIYTPDILDAQSTDFNRTKMSIELVLAGLWPPAKSQIWNTELLWLPIPYNYYSEIEDNLFRSVEYCPKYIEKFDRVLQLYNYQYFLLENADVIEYINENSGLNITSLFEISFLYFELCAQESTGRQLPEWTKKVFPEFLEAGAIVLYEAEISNDELLSIIGGRFVEKVVNDVKSKIDGTLIPKDRKIYLYSAHEYNIVYVLGAMKLYKPHTPPYGSYILIEFHEIEGQHGFKIFYQDYEQPEAQLLQIPECDTFCPLEKFEALHEHLFSDDDTSC